MKIVIKIIKQNEIVCLIFVLCILIFLLREVNNVDSFTNDEKQEMYQNLMSHFKDIFPDSNRNGGGVQFFHYIKQNMNTLQINDHDTFKLYNTFYCAVSGSPIDPNRALTGTIYNHVIIPDMNDNLFYGKYYRCCTPCNCDITRNGNIRVEQYDISINNTSETYHVLTMNDPCSNESEIPGEVSSFTCNSGTTSNGIHTESGRVIIGLLQDVSPYNESNSQMKSDYETLQTNCSPRYDTPSENLQGGMGDIFVLLSEIGN